jgi:L-aspartate oxidase
VFARRIATDILRDLPPQADPAPAAGTGGVLRAELRARLQQEMTAGAGVLRSGASLRSTAQALAALAVPGDRPYTASWEATNLLTVASALVAAATWREETRGCHWREDYPSASPQWRGHLVAGLGAGGRLTETWEALA